MQVYGFIIPSTQRASALKDNLGGLFHPDNFGWGCGYVAVPVGHPWYLSHYDDIRPTNEHEQLSYSNFGSPNDWVSQIKGAELLQEIPEGDYWVVGFDCDHSWNNIRNTPKEEVIKMTKALMSNAINAI
jgi:hypothetical protein